MLKRTGGEEEEKQTKQNRPFVSRSVNSVSLLLEQSSHPQSEVAHQRQSQVSNGRGSETAGGEEKVHGGWGKGVPRRKGRKIPVLAQPHDQI
jgi:hypothetical protein